MQFVNVTDSSLCLLSPVYGRDVDAHVEAPLEQEPTHPGKNTVTYEARLIKSLFLQLMWWNVYSEQLLVTEHQVTDWIFSFSSFVHLIVLFRMAVCVNVNQNSFCESKQKAVVLLWNAPHSFQLSVISYKIYSARANFHRNQALRIPPAATPCGQILYSAWNLATSGCMPNLNFLSPRSQVRVTPGDWKRYHWISGVEFPISVQ